MEDQHRQVAGLVEVDDLLGHVGRPESLAGIAGEGVRRPGDRKVSRLLVEKYLGGGGPDAMAQERVALGVA